MKLHVFDFDGTIFRSPVPHPSLGQDWLDWIQGATVEGMGLGYFQELETLGELAGVPENPIYQRQPPPQLQKQDLPTLASLSSSSSSSSPTTTTKQKNTVKTTTIENNNNNKNDDDFTSPSSFFVHSTIEKAHKAKADGDHVIVLTGRSEYFLPRIRHLLKCCQFPTEDVYAKVDEKAGTVKYKANEISKVVRNLNRGLNKKNLAVTDVILYDDRPEQVEKIATRLSENLSAPWPPPGFIIRGVPATPGTTNGSGCSTVPKVHVVNVSVPEKYIESAESENKLLWKIFSKIKERLGPVREIVNNNNNNKKKKNIITTSNNDKSEGNDKKSGENHSKNEKSTTVSSTQQQNITVINNNNTNNHELQLQLVTIGSVDEVFFGQQLKIHQNNKALIAIDEISETNNNTKHQSSIKLEELLADEQTQEEKQKFDENAKQSDEEKNNEVGENDDDEEEEEQEVIIMDPLEVLVNSLRKLPHLQKFIFKNNHKK